MPRLDQVLVTRGFFSSREQAQRSIMAGQVRVAGAIAAKASQRVKESDELAVDRGPKYVSRGGEKLEHALRHFAVKTSGIRALDVGASTGGFTDCLLQHGAARVVAVDVGAGQLAWTLRQDHRVVVMEKTNARALVPAQFPAPFEPFDLAVVDCSFISLRKILPPIVDLLKVPGRILALIKPQFEAGKQEADRGAGVITDPAVHGRVLAEIEAFVRHDGALAWRGWTESPLRGPAGNKEFFCLLEKV